MTLISKIKNFQRIILHFGILSLLFVCTTPDALAQNKQSLSVSPTLFEMSAIPGQTWRSSVKVINTNPFPLEVYLDVVNFAPEGERGQGKLVPVFEDVEGGTTLAEWITPDKKTVIIPPEVSQEISFLINVPDDAAPGGHFAAILVGTRPPKTTEGKLSIKTSQIVTSLFFLRVQGDVIEKGSIRSFTATESILETPEVEFELRFENKGNVHLLPSGSIEIYNMWGNERGVIPVNQKTNFGNVLPNSIRKFTFVWKGEASLADIGRYRVVASLAYGTDARQFTSQTTYFWILPFKATAIAVTIFIVFALFIRWSIKAYVRRMLMLAGVRPDQPFDKKGRVRLEKDVILTTGSAPTAAATKVKNSSIQKKQPPREGVLAVIKNFITTNKTLFRMLASGLVLLLIIVVYINEVTKDRGYEVIVTNSGSDISINSEDLAFKELITKKAATSTPEQTYKLNLINTSGEPKTAALIGALLSEKAYQITKVSVDTQRRDNRSIIVFDVDLKDQALALSEELGGALLSARTATSTDGPSITIYVGADQRQP